MPSRLTPRRVAARATRPLRRTLAQRETARSVRRYVRACEADVIVCWDLDNTLVDSGSLLRAGLELSEAVASAEPMASMLEFFTAVSEAIPGAEHVVLSARPAVLRVATIAWLTSNGLSVEGDCVWLVPDATAKVAVWRQLARRARLVIVDDLSYGHEGDARATYDDLVATASRLATTVVGLADIEAIGVGSDAVKQYAKRVAVDLAAARGGRLSAPRTAAGIGVS